MASWSCSARRQTTPRQETRPRVRNRIAGSRRLSTVVAASAVLALLSGCSAARQATESAARPSPSAAQPTTTSAPPAPAPAPAPTTLGSAPGYRASIRVIDSETAVRMSSSWRPGCPVPLERLRLITLSHWGFDGESREGELVIAADYAEEIVAAFDALYSAQFPIEQIRLVDEFGADDDRSMAANNTSAFNCRAVSGSQRWSEHAYGRAIDINPVQNPYVTRSGGVFPPAGASYTDRSSGAKGMIAARGPVTDAFSAIGWGWGGNWSSGKDYQHFSSSGR